MFPDLRTFMDRLRAESDLVTITAPVDAHLEAAEIHRRVIAAGGPALLFTNVKGRDFPLVTNLFGTAKRAELAFGQHPMRMIRRIVELAQTIMPPDAGKLWGARDVAGSLLKVGLKRQSVGPVTEVVTRDPRLDRLPALTTWPLDGGPFVTLPLVYTEHPGGHGHNLAMYRLHVHDAQSTGMHWQIGKGGGFHYALAEAANQPLPVTVFLGGPPALILSAIAPLPENVPELMLASLIAGERLARVPGSFGHPHPLVANAEFALMGEVYTREILGVKNPRIGLLSIGEEDSKGNDTSKEAFKILKALPGLNFVGNVESKDVFKSKVDVVACDGFVGNVVLKTSEAVASAMSKWLKASLTASLRRKLCALLLKDAFMEIKHKTDPETYGGAPLLGVNGTVIIGHGSSSARAVRNGIRNAATAVHQHINEHMIEAMKRLPENL